MKTSLYEINNGLLNLFEEIENADGVITEEQEQELQIKQNQLESKSIAYLEVIKASESLNKRIDEEIKRLQSIKKNRNNLIDRLKNNLLNAVNLFGEYEVGLHTFKKRKSTSVSVEDVNSLPSDYKVKKVTEQADKKAIKKALEEGEEIKGCSINTNYSLYIK